MMGDHRLVTELTLTDPRADVAVGTRRAEVLAVLREAGRPLSVQQTAEQTGLHLNTARFHLDGLVADGLAERAAEERGTPGRPRILYGARAERPGPRSFALLAEMLTGLVVSLGGAGPAALEAGRAWGRHLVDRPPPSRPVDADDATARLNRMLAEIGFEPEMSTGSDGVEVRLHHCPFRGVAERHSDVVCAIHLGMMQGALGELRAPLEAQSLEPFATPSLCVGRLRPTSAGRPG
jgi:predicted ArsR family transcriptional regulator